MKEHAESYTAPANIQQKLPPWVPAWMLYLKMLQNPRHPVRLRFHERRRGFAGLQVVEGGTANDTNISGGPCRSAAVAQMAPVKSGIDAAVCVVAPPAGAGDAAAAATDEITAKMKFRGLNAMCLS
jgi:hypothetical protein